MKQFKLNLFKGHAIINDGENIILIDTGVPSTIHTSDSLNFFSEIFECTTNYHGVTVSAISDLLGTEITTVLGADILSNYKILFDYKNKVIEFSKEEIEFDGDQADLSYIQGVPIIKMMVDNQEHKFFLDTGAQISYLSDSLTRNYV